MEGWARISGAPRSKGGVLDPRGGSRGTRRARGRVVRGWRSRHRGRRRGGVSVAGVPPGVVWQCGGSERRRFALKSRSATKLDLAGTYRLTAGPAAGEAKFWMHRAGARPAAIQGGGKGLRPEIQDP